jgi:hypothetical protein
VTRNLPSGCATEINDSLSDLAWMVLISPML